MTFGKMPLRRWTRPQSAVVAVSLIYALVFLVMLVLHPGSRRAYEAFENTYQIIPPLFAGLCGVAYAVRGQHGNSARRAGWLLIGLACFSSSVGQSTWTYYESIRGVEVPSPGWADVGYVGAYFLLVLGVVFLFGSMPVAGRTRQLLDGAIAASSVGVLSWYFVVERLWQKSDITLLGKIVSVAYPLGDIACLFGAVVLFSSASKNKGLRASVAFLASGLVLFTFFDTTYTYLSLNDAYHTGSWCDWAWSFGFIMIGYASLAPLWWRQTDSDAGESAAHPTPVVAGPLKVVAPYFAVAAAFSIVAGRDFLDDGVISNSTVLSGIGLLILVITRQVFTLLENQHLTGVLRSFNENLENVVARRTKQLTSLLRLTKAVNSTLEVQQVLNAATEHTLQALHADAVVLKMADPESPGTEHCLPVVLQQGLEQRPDALSFVSKLPISLEVELIPLPVEIEAQQPSQAAYLRAPLIWQQRLIGMIGVIRWAGGFGQTDREMLESIGIETGTALENARAYSAALDAADRDSVTGLYNHRALHQRLEKELKRAQAQHRALSVIMMDMNNFKLFNDTYGHPVGDQVLKRVAHALREECDHQSLLGRYGGDEFLVALPEMDTETAMRFADQIRHRMTAESFHLTGDDRKIPVTLSFGIATFPWDGRNRHELLTVADANLYKAKGTDAGIVGASQGQRAHQELRTEGSFGVLDAMVTAVDNKDRYTRRHSEDVTEYALWIAEELGWSEETMRIIRVGGLLHDVGKIGVPAEILCKPGRLTAEEYEILKRHPQLGALIVGAIPGMESILDAVRSHHERWDGQGYPDALAGEEIPLLGRVMAVADAFSAMTTDRPYRKGLDWDAACKEIEANIATQFDPAMARAFLAAAKKRRPAHGQAEMPGIEELRKAA